MSVSWTKPALATLTVATFLSFPCSEILAAQQKTPAPEPEKAKKTLELKPKEFERLVPSQLSKTPVTVIDLASALSLGGVRNPQLLLARERILEVTALRQLAAARLLPSLHMGTSFNNHDGNLQQSTGNVIGVNRGSYYIGAGASAVGAGTVTIPGVDWNLNVSDVIFKALESRQVVRRRQFEQRVVENAMLLRIALAYLAIVRAEGHRALALRNLENSHDVVRVLDAYVEAGQGRQSDADRARTDFYHRQEFLQQAEGDVLTASARLAELLDLPPEPRLHPLEDRVVPSPAVPDPISLPELLAIAALNRPELQAQQAGIRQAFLQLEGAKLLPFSPTVIVGCSYGGEAGGGTQTSPRFGDLNGRADFDAALFWTLQNLSFGNLSQIKMARSNLASANLELVRQLNDVRAEVAVAHAQIRARLLQIETCEHAVNSITRGYSLDFARIRGFQGLPIELLNSLGLLGEARLAYLDAIVDYNEAQMQLYVALGQPPANTLARPVSPGASPPATTK
jgi:outer membrane protein TolC